MENEALYPLLLRMIAVERPWSGDLLAAYGAANPALPSGQPGEVWLLADDSERSSCIANGPMAQTPITELVRHRGTELIGRQSPANATFPLAIRLLNVGTNLPIQVHPVDNDASVPAQTSARFWHCLASHPGSGVIVGIPRHVTNQQLLLNVDKPGFERLLQRYPGRPGDSFIVPPGFIHAIGGGNLILEVQQRSGCPVTLRTWNGEAATDPRQVASALSSANTEARHNVRISREAGTVSHTRRIPLTPHCPYFDIEELRLVDHIFLRTGDRFHLVVPVRGAARLLWRDQSLKLAVATLACVPAVCGDYKIEAENGPCELLKITL